MYPTKDEYNYRQKKKKEFANYYAIKYNISANTHSELLEYIYRYEMENYLNLLRCGVDKITGEVGYFIILTSTSATTPNFLKI